VRCKTGKPLEYSPFQTGFTVFPGLKMS